MLVEPKVPKRAQIRTDLNNNRCSGCGFKLGMSPCSSVVVGSKEGGASLNMVDWFLRQLEYYFTGTNSYSKLFLPLMTFWGEFL